MGTESSILLEAGRGRGLRRVVSWKRQKASLEEIACTDLCLSQRLSET